MVYIQVLNNLLRNQADRVPQDVRRGVYSALSNSLTQLNDNARAPDGPDWIQFCTIADMVLKWTAPGL